MLSRRALNRALLQRQLLLRRTALTAPEAIEHLVGLQAQSPTAPYFGLLGRLERFRAEDLSAGLVDRSLVRIVLMRGTIHLVRAGDALELRPLVQPVLDRDLRTNVTHGPGIEGLDLGALGAAARALLEERPMAATELGEALRKRWRSRPAASLAHAARNVLPLVQPPPRGVWGKGGKPMLTTAEAWLGGSLARRPSPERLVRRYLAAFGPASARDAQTWSGLAGIGELLEKLRPELRTFRDEQGRELFDVADGPLPEPDTPAPVRLIAPFDNLLVSHADRARILSEPARKRVFSAKNGQNPGTVLVDGFVAGTWRLEQARRSAAVRIETFEPLPRRARPEAREEAERLLAFAAPDAESKDVALSVA